jgi:hypothetical protein
MNNIVNSISNLTFQPNTSTDATDSFVDRFVRRIFYLHIPRPDYIDATRFPNVRSLEFFDCLSEDQLRQVRHKHFVNLVYLRMCYIEDSDIASAFFQMIFSNEFPSLSKCILDEIPLPDSNHQWSSSPSLGFLIANGFCLSVYFLILSSCPNLINLHWSRIQ